VNFAINPNVRSSVAFSAKRDVMRRGQPIPTQAPQPKFGATPLYYGPYNNVHVITDFQDQASNARIYQRFQEVQKFLTQHRPSYNPLQWLANWRDEAKHKQAQGLKEFEWDESELWQNESQTGLLNHSTISDIPLRNIDSASQTLFELAHEPNRDIFIHVTDPGVGSGKEAHKRSILISENHGVHIGPNNGSLGLLAKFLKNKEEPFEVREIDLEKISRLEGLRTGKEKADNGNTFHGRDVFGVAGAAIASGLSPQSLSKDEPIEPVYSPFSQARHLPVSKGESTFIQANRDNTSGNLVLNVALSPDELQALQDQKAKFRLGTAAGKAGVRLDLPVKKTFGEVEKGQPILYLGSKNAPTEGKRFMEVAINCGDISQKLQLRPKESAFSLSLTKL
jgi:S-adenosylmethionine hydrolase